MKIAVCVPHTGSVKAATTQCLGQMLVYTAAAKIRYNGKPTRPDIQLIFGGAGPLEYKRTKLALAALGCGSDYLVWIDSDQTFPGDALIRLMLHDKPVVGGNYPSRHEDKPTALDRAGKPLPRRTGLEEVGALGFGFCLMQTPILRRVPQPWFSVTLDARGDCISGEDVHFCNQARKAGIPIFVDHDLEIGHVTNQVLTLKREDANADSVSPQAGAQ